MRTLKLSLLLFATLVTVKTVNAQSRKIELGIRAGANYSTLYGEPQTYNRKGKTNFVAGAFVRGGDKLYVESGAYFARHGSRFDLNGFRYDAKFSTLQIPVLVGYKIIDKKDFNVHAAAGPEANFNLDKLPMPTGSEYKSFNAAGKANAGVDLGPLTIDLNATYGIDKVNKKLDQRTGMYSLTVGFKF